MNKFTYENTPLGKIASGYVEEVGAVEPRNTYNQKIAGGEYRQDRKSTRLNSSHP